MSLQLSTDHVATFPECALLFITRLLIHSRHPKLTQEYTILSCLLAAIAELAIEKHSATAIKNLSKGNNYLDQAIHCYNNLLAGDVAGRGENLGDIVEKAGVLLAEISDELDAMRAESEGEIREETIPLVGEHGEAMQEIREEEIAQVARQDGEIIQHPLRVSVGFIEREDRANEPLALPPMRFIVRRAS